MPDVMIMNDRPLDPYIVLELNPAASQAQITRAYRALLLRYHPDTRGPQDPVSAAAADTALRQVIAAYATLRDPEHRARHDQAATTDQRNRQAHTIKAHYLREAHRAWPHAETLSIRVSPVRWHSRRMRYIA